MTGHPLTEIAARTGGRLIGEPDLEVVGVAPIDHATGAHLSFLDPGRSPDLLRGTRAGAVLIETPVEGCAPAQVVVPNVRLALAQALELFVRPISWGHGVDPSAQVHPDAVLDESAIVGPLAVIGAGCRVGPRSRIDPGAVLYPGVTIGADCHVQARSVLREGTELGDRVILQPGVVLGADGFGYAQTAEHTHHKIPQLGIVIIEDDVEIGAGSCVDRGTMGATRIRRGAKIDNLVQIGHNCDLGEHVILCGQSGVAGSCTVGHHVMLGGQAGVADHVRIGEGAQIGAAAGVHADIPPGAGVLGAPAIDAREFAKLSAAMRKLPEALRLLRRLERTVEGKKGR
jgi:UDP-3-O-[3-hydroxymyristoyl] glucosamine N-acyltransferase